MSLVCLLCVSVAPSYGWLWQCARVGCEIRNLPPNAAGNKKHFSVLLVFEEVFNKDILELFKKKKFPSTTPQLQ